VVRKLILLLALPFRRQGWILREEFLSPNLRARFCSSILPIFRLQCTCFCVPSFQDLFVFRLVQNPPPGFFQTGSGAFPAAPSVRAFDTTIQREKSPQALCTSKAILDFHFLEVMNLLGLLNCNRQNRDFCEFGKIESLGR